jgi:hypothetical protein
MTSQRSLAALFRPNARGHDDVSGRRVAEFAIPLGRIAIEVEQQRRNLLVEAVEVKRLSGGDDFRDLTGGRTKGIAATFARLAARDDDEIHHDHDNTHRGVTGFQCAPAKTFGCDRDQPREHHRGGWP